MPVLLVCLLFVLVLHDALQDLLALGVTLDRRGVRFVLILLDVRAFLFLFLLILILIEFLVIIELFNLLSLLLLELFAVVFMNLVTCHVVILVDQLLELLHEVSQSLLDAQLVLLDAQ